MTLQGRPILWICAVGFIAACKSESKDQVTTQPAAPVTASAESSATRVQDSAQPTSGVDHSNMPGMKPSAGTKASVPSAGGAAPVAVVDHSKMNMAPAASSPAPRSKAATDMPGMDHSQMDMGPANTGTARRAATPAASMQGTAGMDHSQMAGMQTPAMSANQIADRKLQMIAAALLKDPDILRRVQADSVLRNRWSDPSVRTQISAAAGSEHK